MDLTRVRQAVRALSRQPGYAVATVAMLAIGAGATTAAYALASSLLWRPLPFASPERLVRLSEAYDGAVATRGDDVLSNVTYHAWRDRGSATLAGLAAYQRAELLVAVDGVSVRVQGARVDADLFVVLGTAPAEGRWFTRDDVDALPVVVSARWAPRGEGALRVGSGLTVNGRPAVVVGVAPASFRFPDEATLVWVPLDVPRAEGPAPTIAVMPVVGRLRPGVSGAEVEREGAVVLRERIVTAAAIGAAFGTAGTPRIRAVTLHDALTRDVRPFVVFAWLAAAAVTLVAAANVAGLVLVRCLTRLPELAVRLAVGASGQDAARPLLIEVLLLSVAAAVAGGGVAHGVVAALRAYGGGVVPRLAGVHVDAAALAVAFCASVGLAVAAASGPAALAVRRAVRLRAGDRGLGTLPGQAGASRRGRRVVLGIEATCAAVAVVAAVLAARSVMALLAVDPGYRTEGVTVARVSLPGGDEVDGRRAQVTHALLERVRMLPGVTAAGATNMLPFDRANFSAGFPVPGDYRRALPPGVAPRTAAGLRYAVTPGYLDALGVRVVAGRTFTDADTDDRRARWIVSESFARRFLPPNPVGRRFPWSANGREVELEIVGVVGDVLKDGLDRAPEPAFYTVMDDVVWGDARVVVRATAPAARMAGDLQRVAREIAPDAAIEVAPLETVLAASLESPRLLRAVLGSLAALAVLLAVAGIHALTSYEWSRRRHELALRVALGARRDALMRLAIAGVLADVVPGIVVGCVVGAAVSSWLAGRLFGVSAGDPLVVLSPALVLVPVAVGAVLPPAVRAARVTPAEALRGE